MRPSRPGRGHSCRCAEDPSRAPVPGLAYSIRSFPDKTISIVHLSIVPLPFIAPQYARDPRRMSDVTAHVPSLAALLAEDAAPGSDPTLALATLMEEEDVHEAAAPAPAAPLSSSMSSMELEDADTGAEGAAGVADAQASPGPPPSPVLSLAPAGAPAILESPDFVGFGTARRPAPTPTPAAAAVAAPGLQFDMRLSPLPAAADTPNLSMGPPSGASAPRSVGLVSPPGGETTQGLRSKWGFMPGGDDTLTLDVRGNGAALLGDATFHQMYVAGAGETMNLTRKTPGGAQRRGAIAEETEEEDEGAGDQEDTAVLPARPWMLGKSPKPAGSHRGTPFKRRPSACLPSPSVTLGSPVPSASLPGGTLAAPSSATPQTRGPQHVVDIGDGAMDMDLETAEGSGAGAAAEAEAEATPSPAAGASAHALAAEPPTAAALPASLAHLSSFMRRRGVSEVRFLLL